MRLDLRAPVAPVPAAVPKLWLVRAMRDAALKSAFDLAMAGAPADTQEDWALAAEIRRDDPLVPLFAAALGVSDAAVDDLFRLAARLSTAG